MSSTNSWHQSHPSRGRHRSQKKDGNGSSDLPFVHFTAQTVSRNKDADKLIRAQAAKASASRRLETMEKRRKLKRGTSTDSSSRPTPPISPTFGDGEMLLFEPLMTLRTKSAPPTTTAAEKERELTAPSSSLSPPTPPGWKCGLASIVEDTFITAIHALNASKLRCDTDVIWEAFENPSLYDDPLMVQCLELLVTTGPSSSRLALSRSTIDLTRHQLLIAVQRAVQYQNGESLALVPVVALLAGWEAVFGDESACKFHLTALSGITPVHSPRRKRTAGSIAAACIPIPAERLAPGFRFYMSLDLLPSCLLRQIEQINNPNNDDEAIISKRRAALAAVACTPSIDALSPASPIEPNSLADAVAAHVQLAAALLALLIRIDSNTESADLKECLAAWHAESLLLLTESLFGTIYDEILLWSLSVFCAAGGQGTGSEQVDVLVTGMENLNVKEWSALEALLGRYVCPTALVRRMRRVLGHVFFQES